MSQSSLLPFDILGQEQHGSVQNEYPADDLYVGRYRLDIIGDEHRSDKRKSGYDYVYDHLFAVVKVGHSVLPAEQLADHPEKRGNKRENVLCIDDKHRDKGGKVKKYEKGEIVGFNVALAEYRSRDGKVSGGRNGEKFRQTLYDAVEDCR